MMGGGGGGGQPANQAQPVPGTSSAPTDGVMQQMLAQMAGQSAQAKPSLGAIMQPMGMGGQIMPPMPPMPVASSAPLPPMPGGTPMPNLLGAFQQGSNAIAKTQATPMVKPPPRPGVGAVPISPPPLGKPASAFQSGETMHPYLKFGGAKSPTIKQDIQKYNIAQRKNRVGGSNK